MSSLAQMAGYDADGLGYKCFRPDLVLIPGDADEMVRVIKVLHEAHIPICLRGAGTSLSGGPVAVQGGCDRSHIETSSDSRDIGEWALV